MDLRPIPARDWADWYTQELCASFPACECKPLEAIRALAAEGCYELLGLYDGAALLGYATLWSTPEWPDYVLLDYLGVTAARRNGGLGGAILKMLAARETGRRTVLVEAEAERSGGPEEERPLRLLCQVFVLGPAPADRADLKEAHRAIYGPARTDVVIDPPPGASPEPPYWM